MKVAITLTVTVDPETWEDEYGVAGAAALREDVRSYVTTLVQGSAAACSGAISDVKKSH